MLKASTTSVTLSLKVINCNRGHDGGTLILEVVSLGGDIWGGKGNDPHIRKSPHQKPTLITWLWLSTLYNYEENFLQSPVNHHGMTNPSQSTSFLMSWVQTKLKQSENLALNYQPVESTSNPSPQGTVSYFQIILLHDVITFCGLNVSAPKPGPETKQWMWWGRERQTLWGD